MFSVGSNGKANPSSPTSAQTLANKTHQVAGVQHPQETGKGQVLSPARECTDIFELTKTYLKFPIL